MKILVVDDDLDLADVISFTLRRAGFEILLAYDGRAALDRWQSESPDLIILDINLPKLDGTKVCQQIRQQSDTPIIMLTVRSNEDDIVRGLEIGADDYIVKPFSPRQLVARVEAVLRRAGSPQVISSPITVNDFTFDPSRNEVQKDGNIIAHLTPLESRLMEILMINNNHVLLTDTLIDNVWGPAGGDRTMLKQLVYRVRKKIECDLSNPVYLITVSGVGYTFTP
ncbi:MAG TPA: response regulator transcription factor [Anaerolineales bacterium]|nr:response regulator transcription factor [Anaerolineales bacterium]